MPETPTPRLQLRKPLNDGSELVNVQTDLNQNADRIDLAVGYQVVTSTTRPSTPYSGKAITESDTGYRAYFSNGSAPASGSWVQIPTAGSTFNADLQLVAGKQLNIGASGSTASIAVVNSTPGADAISLRVTGDTQSRWVADTDGTLNWGPGASGATDTNLYRSAANTLATDDDFAINIVGKGLRIKEGTNAKMGTATLNGTTAVVVSTTAVTATSRIQLTIQTPNAGTAGSAYVSTRTAGTSFSIKSTNAADVSTVAWMLVEPA
ncbi:hypothetical protein ACWEAF_05655 [Streptomyces sp. NPDC005071]